MKIYQIVTTLGYGDAVGNNIIALLDALKRAGYQTKVFAEAIDDRIEFEDIEDINMMPEVEENDIILYHLATGTELNFRVADYPCKRILVYHNITPPHFFQKYNMQALENCEWGLEGTKFLADKVDYGLADSFFNKEELIRMGYQCKLDVQPILVKFDDYTKTPNRRILQQMNDGYENILFVGRIAPNKKQEDVIAAFAMYKRHYNPNSRLILAGSYSGMEKYYNCLANYIAYNQIEDVIFTGHIRFDEILAYYHNAHIFLCMSEHEGFCVPLIEAMYFDVPIIAYNSTAIAGTLDGAGILLEKKDPVEVAAWMNCVSRNHSLRGVIINNQRERLQFFSEEKIRDSFITYMKEFIGG